MFRSREMPLTLRLRQAWDDLSPPQRVNRGLYGLAFASMLGLLVELGVGGRSPDLDVASAPASTVPLPLAGTTPSSPTTATGLSPAPAGTGRVSLADIVAQVAAAPSPAEARSDTAGRAPVTTTSAGSAVRPPSVEPGGGSSPAPGSSPATGSSPAPTQVTAQPAPPAATQPQPAVTSPSTTTTVPPVRPPRPTVTFDDTDFTVPDRTGTTRRDRAR